MQQVLEEHRQLEASIAAMRAFLEQPRPDIGDEAARDWSAQLSKDLVELHHLLVRHFRYEEDGGMMTDLSEKHPRADRWVDDLVDEHRELLHDVRSITESVMFYEEGRRAREPGHPPPPERALRPPAQARPDGDRADPAARVRGAGLGGVTAFQAVGRGFDSRLPLHFPSSKTQVDRTETHV